MDDYNNLLDANKDPEPYEDFMTKLYLGLDSIELSLFLTEGNPIAMERILDKIVPNYDIIETKPSLERKGQEDNFIKAKYSDGRYQAFCYLSDMLYVFRTTLAGEGVVTLYGQTFQFWSMYQEIQSNGGRNWLIGNLELSKSLGLKYLHTSYLQDEESYGIESEAFINQCLRFAEIFR